MERDPNNTWLSFFPRRRLDAEALRDALLMLSGNLATSPCGPHPFPPQPQWNFTQHNPFRAVYDSNHRSVYLMTQRIQRHPFLALFDGPDTNASTATRVSTTTPLQALFLMNDPFVHEQARQFAARIRTEGKTDEARIERAFVRLFARPPSAEETKQALERQTATSEILRVIASSPTDVEPVLDAIARSAARLCGTDDVTVYLVEGPLLRRVAGHGSTPPAPLGATRPITRGSVSGRAIIDRCVVHPPGAPRAGERRSSRCRAGRRLEERDAVPPQAAQGCSGT